MKLKAIVACAIAACALALCCSCTNDTHEYAAEDYFLDVDYTSNFRILQLSDIHLGAKDAQNEHFAYMDNVITKSKCNMIVATGDLFTYADKTTALRLFDFFDSYGVPWTVTFGNHDEQCYFSIDWMTDTLNNYGSHCVFKDIQDDNVFGNANFFINLKKDGKVFEQLLILDSNRYNYGAYFGYDFIKQSQIDWYERMVNYSTSVNGAVVPSILFCHIPVPETEDAWNAALAGSPDAKLLGGEAREGVSSPKYNSGFYDKAVELGSTHGMFFGHDHVNDWVVLYKGMYIGYGVTSTDRVYGDKDMMGGRIIVLHDDHSLTFENIFETYEWVRDYD